MVIRGPPELASGELPTRHGKRALHAEGQAVAQIGVPADAGARCVCKFLPEKRREMSSISKPHAGLSMRAVRYSASRRCGCRWRLRRCGSPSRLAPCGWTSSRPAVQGQRARPFHLASLSLCSRRSARGRSLGTPSDRHGNHAECQPEGLTARASREMWRVDAAGRRRDEFSRSVRCPPLDAHTAEGPGAPLLVAVPRRTTGARFNPQSDQRLIRNQIRDDAD